jgi:hypothetical protein
MTRARIARLLWSNAKLVIQSEIRDLSAERGRLWVCVWRHELS